MALLFNYDLLWVLEKLLIFWLIKFFFAINGYFYISQTKNEPDPAVFAPGLFPEAFTICLVRFSITYSVSISLSDFKLFSAVFNDEAPSSPSELPGSAHWSPPRHTSPHSFFCDPRPVHSSPHNVVLSGSAPGLQCLFYTYRIYSS